MLLIYPQKIIRGKKTECIVSILDVQIIYCPLRKWLIAIFAHPEQN